jgi:hypothetical protein
MTLAWGALALFMIAVVLLALYGLTVSGHFPAEARAPALRSALGAIILWTTLVEAGVAAMVAIAAAPRVLPWPAIVIGGGAMLLFAPLLLRPLPDRFVNGHAGLLSFAGGALLAAVGLWVVG